jgi:hypothetical protein
MWFLCWFNNNKKFGGRMKQESLYRQLADDAFKDAAEEENAQLLAQWKVLGADGWNSRLNPTTPAKKTHWSLGVSATPV